MFDLPLGSPLDLGWNYAVRAKFDTCHTECKHGKREREWEREMRGSTKALQHLAIVVVVQILSASVAARTNIKINSLWPTHVLEWRQQRFRGDETTPLAFLPRPHPRLHSQPTPLRTWQTFRLSFAGLCKNVLPSICIFYLFLYPFWLPPESAALEFASPISGMSLLPPPPALPHHPFRQSLSLSPDQDYPLCWYPFSIVSARLYIPLWHSYFIK